MPKGGHDPRRGGGSRPAPADPGSGRLGHLSGESDAGARVDPGLRELAGRGDRPALLYVPAAASRRRPLPLLVYFHGAGGKPRSGIDLLRQAADDIGAAVLAPASISATWDAIGGHPGRDVAAVDDLLRRVARELPVDTSRVVMTGFSDGASYALSLGLVNGDLVRGIAAFSPGFIATSRHHGKPPVFISHGTRDRVLPIQRTSRQIVARLERGGYSVTYREFGGAHEVPPAIVRHGVEGILGS